MNNKDDVVTNKIEFSAKKKGGAKKSCHSITTITEKYLRHLPLVPITRGMGKDTAGRDYHLSCAQVNKQCLGEY